MAKAIAAYFGNDSYGRSIEVSKRVDGTWFYRSYGWNGYGKTWSKWTQWNPEGEIHPKRIRCAIECANAPEFIEIPEDEQENMIWWGWNTFTKFSETPKFRLPN